MKNKFENEFEKWLWSDKKDWNPFIKVLSEEAREWPEVERPEVYQNLKQYLDPLNIDIS